MREEPDGDGYPEVWQPHVWQQLDREPPELELTVTDNPVVGVLYGPDGAVLVEVHERPRRPFGFHPA